MTNLFLHTYTGLYLGTFMLLRIYAFLTFSLLVTPHYGAEISCLAGFYVQCPLYKHYTFAFLVPKISQR